MKWVIISPIELVELSIFHINCTRFRVVGNLHDCMDVILNIRKAVRTKIIPDGLCRGSITNS